MKFLLNLKLKLWCLAFSVMIVLVLPSQAEENVTLLPPVLENKSLSLEWWVNTASKIKSADLFIDDRIVNSQADLEPNRGLPICYMLMVDSSKSMKRHFTNNSIKQLLTGLVVKKPDQHFLGLALFAEDWKLLSAPTRNKDILERKISNIKPSGKRTELLRYSLKALNSFGNCPTSSYRKVLIIITDGDAEDRAYSLDSVVQSAVNNNYSIYAFGFKESAALQFPRIMAEKTGGVFLEPEEHLGNKRDNAIDRFYTISNSGGDLRAELPEQLTGDKFELHLTLENNQLLTKKIPLAIEPTITPHSLWKQKIVELIPWLDINHIDNILVAVSLFVFSLLGWLLYRVLHKSTASQSPVGFLISNGQTYPITPGINSLGYLPSNDIVLDNDTVGRAHATLHYQGDGDVVLTDLNSLNGSWINGTRIQRPMSVHDGDSIAFGRWQGIYQSAKQ